MKTLFIPAKSDVKIPLNKIDLKALPNEIALATTVQHLHKLDEVKKYLEKNGIKTKLIGQVLGCTKLKCKTDILFIGSGRFHAINLAKYGNVFVLDPFTGKFSQIEQEEIDMVAKRKKGALIKFYSSQKIGVLVSIKKGQNKMKEAYALEKKYPKKEFFVFVFDTLDFNELENFPFVECWVNTACPRISEDYERIPKPIVNINDIE